MDNLRNILISCDSTIREAMIAIERGGIGIALVVDSFDRIEATVTDGDVRRAILNGLGGDAPVGELAAFRASDYRQPTVAPASTDRSELLKIMQQRSVRHVPLVDDDNRVVDVVLLAELVEQSLDRVSAVVMAGGHGRRLRPLTKDVPKPMLPLDGRPLLERLIGQLERVGIKRVRVTTHYKPEVILDHFGNGNGNGVEIEYLHEELPLGTVGALALMEVPEYTTLVINGDIVTELNLDAMFAFHNDHQADITVAVRKCAFQIPYGVVKTNGIEVAGLVEKPSEQVFVNAGIYLLEPVAYGYIPAGERFDMPDLIDRIIEDGGRVVSFPVVEYWSDIGWPADYERVQIDVAGRRLESWIGTGNACW